MGLSGGTLCAVKGCKSVFLEREKERERERERESCPLPNQPAQPLKKLGTHYRHSKAMLYGVLIMIFWEGEP